MTNAATHIRHPEVHRQAITGHCYRMPGSFFDVEDATQEAMIRARKGMVRFDGRASVATNVRAETGAFNTIAPVIFAGVTWAACGCGTGAPDSCC